MIKSGIFARMRILKILLLLIVLMVLGAGGTLYWAYQDLRRPQAHTASQEIIVIDSGVGKKAIIQQLTAKGIIAHSWPVILYVAWRGDKEKLQAGDYRFESPITPLTVLAKLRQGLVVTAQFTVPEGYDKFDALARLVTTERGSQSDFQSLIESPELIADLDPAATDLEGYLFPDTYVYTRRYTPAQIVATMVRRFRSVWTPARQQRAVELGLTLRQVITLASLVEREAKQDDERALIAAVFHNRLKKGMRLDCDPTFIYAAKLANVWDHDVNNPLHRRRASAYNTYYTTGLPPGPIASPGVKSIDAALYPANVDYLYFVVNGTAGRHKFSVTEAEHQIAVAAYRQQQRRAKQAP
jgi:UPF0755 protein